MNNEETIMTEEETRSDLTDQVTEETEVSWNPVDITDGTDGPNIGLIAGITALGTAVITGGIIFAKKKINPDNVKRKFENIKANNELRKNRRQAKKEIKARCKNEIKALYHPVEDKTSETPEVVNSKIVDVKGTSKKK